MAAAPIILGGAAVGGTVISMIGQSQEAEAREKAARQEAEARRQLANETLLRARFNERLLQEEADLARGQISSRVAASGGSGGRLSLVGDMAARAQMEIFTMRREAQYRAAQLFSGASQIEGNIADMKSAAKLRMLGTGLAGVGRAASLYDPAKGGGGSGDFDPKSYYDSTTTMTGRELA